MSNTLQTTLKTTSDLRWTILTQLRMFLELTRDMERNQDDHIFSSYGGNIHYVFDENVFEFFLDPVARSNYVKLFNPRPINERELRRDFSPQSAIITAEYLLGACLPGESEKRIFITEWHFSELYDRFKRIVSEARMHDEAGLCADYQLRVTLPPLRGLYSLENADEATRLDYEALASQLGNPGKESDLLRRFIAARNIAFKLSQLTGPITQLQQLQRLFSPEISKAFKPMNGEPKFRVGRDDQSELRELARSWLYRIDKEYYERGGAERGERTKGSRSNDARALAYVSWAAERLSNTKERVVLVTGDRLVFDAYRRWYTDENRNEPFLLRRIAQFAPLINFQDAGSDAGGDTVFFTKVRTSVEAALFPFNLAGRDDHIPKGREHLALQLAALKTAEELDKATNLSPFTLRLDAEWLLQRREELGDLMSRWHNIEGAAVGAHYSLLEGRYEFLTKGQHVQRDASDESQQMEFIAGYINALLQGISAVSMRVFLPFVIAFIQEMIESNSRQDVEQSRVPLSLKFDVPSAASENDFSKLLDFQSFLDRWRDSDQETRRILDVNVNPHLTEEPAFLFGIAAALALDNGLWSDADRFSEVAAYNAVPYEQQIAEDGQAELVYLEAVAKRFQLGATHAPRSGLPHEGWSRPMQVLMKILQKCEDYHSMHHQPLRLMRTISERAAARLFCVVLVLPLEDLHADHLINQEAEKTSYAALQLKEAFDDLQKCLDLEKRCDGLTGEQATIRGALLPRVARQYTINLAAALCLVHCLAAYGFPPSEFLTDVDEKTNLVQRRLETWTAEQQKHLARAGSVDVLALRAFQSDRAAAVELRNLAKDKGALRLPVDRRALELYLAILRQRGELV